MRAGRCAADAAARREDGSGALSMVPFALLMCLCLFLIIEVGCYVLAAQSVDSTARRLSRMAQENPGITEEELRAAAANAGWIATLPEGDWTVSLSVAGADGSPASPNETPYLFHVDATETRVSQACWRRVRVTLSASYLPPTPLGRAAVAAAAASRAFSGLVDATSPNACASEGFTVSCSYSGVSDDTVFEGSSQW